MAELTIAKSLNKAYRQVPVERPVFNIFKAQLSNYYKQISSIDTEEKLKGDLMDFLKFTFYSQNYKVSPNGDIDCAIHLGVNVTDPVGVIIEVKKPTNATEMITKEDLNRKALQELLLYYLRERHIKKNIQLKQLIVTNVYEYFVFDAHEFERIFYSNKKLIKRFEEFNAGALTSEKTDFFYKEIAADFIANVLDQITYTWFDIRKYKQFLDTGNDKRIIELFKFFSPEHLLKKRFQNDSNSLNTKFYSELLYIIGLEEVVEKDSKKHIITRRKEVERNQASLLENTITILDSEDWLDNVKDRYSFGKNRQEQLFGVALALTIGWANRILFLKLLEAQLVKYHKGDQSYAFMRPSVIPDYDELNKLFFQVLAKRITDRSESINTKYGKVPYLNSSLFEISPLERQTIRISSLDNSELPLFNGTVLKDGQKPRYDKLPTLRYLLEFLDAYDFSSEGSEEVQEQAKTLINASVLGLIFEKINGHRDGSVFTPGAVTMYMSREAIQQTVVRRFNEEMGWSCKDYEALKNKDIEDYVQANAVIDSLRICDPAVGSGHFLVSVLNEVIYTKYDLGILIDGSGKRIKKQDYSIDIENDELLISDEDGNPVSYIPGNQESQRIQETLFNEKRKIIENCLFGVDINPNAVNICRLRLWIELLKNAYYTKESDYTELETLPNIDINIKVGNSLLHRFNLGQDISEILRKSGISISAYRKAVSDYKNAHSKEEKHDLENYLRQIKGNLRTQIGLKDPKVVSLNKLNADLDNLLAPQLFEISKKEQAQRDKQAKDLQAKIAKIQTEVDEIKDNKIFVGAFEWRIEFPEVLDEDGRFVGFDCVIGNPPYMRIQSLQNSNPEIVDYYSKHYQAATGSFDIYVLFVELAHQLIKGDGLVHFIMPVKWTNSDFGKGLRGYLAKEKFVSRIINLKAFQVFDASTYTGLQWFKSSDKLQYVEMDDSITTTEGFSGFLNSLQLSDYAQIDYNTDAPWTLANKEVNAILEKLRKNPYTLADVFESIFQGLATSKDDVYFLYECKELDNLLVEGYSKYLGKRITIERGLVKPLLKGEDVHRYMHLDSDRYVIFPYKVVNEKASLYSEEEMSDLFPSGYEYLKACEPELRAREKGRLEKDTFWYRYIYPKNLTLFEQIKIVAPEISLGGNFTIDSDGRYYSTTTVYGYIRRKGFSGSYYTWMSILNSKLCWWFITQTGTVLANGYYRYKPAYLKPFPVPVISQEIDLQLTGYAKSLIENSDTVERETISKRVDRLIYELYNLSEAEMEIIENC